MSAIAVLEDERRDVFNGISWLHVVDLRSDEVIAFHCLTRQEAHQRAALQFGRLISQAVKDHPLHAATQKVEPDFVKLAKQIGTLRGKNLACWCPADMPCHADMLLELANASEAV